MRGLRHAIGGAFRAAIDLLLPPHCPICDAATDAAHALCAACFSRTGFVTEPCCPICGVPFAFAEQAGAGGLCGRCGLQAPPYRRARAALRYDAQARRLILPLKHADRIELARTLAPMMMRAGAALLHDADLLVPVPLHRHRLRARRYNQAAVLARAVGRLSDRPLLADALTRSRATAPLGTKSASERYIEMENVIAIRPSLRHRVCGRRVLLVDDVMTSGATAASCARALLAAGAVSVDVLAAARVPDPRLA
ncbi:MAG: ComF family protein [Acetobacteraceae bacterium]|nr:ComF family protein [Acetobacteraceae bacterium]